MRIFSISLLLLVLAAPGASRAQDGVDVVGQVLDETTDAPVEGALVTIEGRAGGVVTDASGAFAFDSLPTGLFRFRIERLGYWPTVMLVELSRSDSLQFRVAPNPLVAERIEVVIDVLEGRRQAVPYATRSYGPRRLAPHVALDLEEFLRRRAGLHLVPCRTRAFGPTVPGPPGCLPHRGRTNPIRVWVDERPVFGGLDATFGYEMTEIHSVEVIAGCGMVRVYTRRFMDAVAAGRQRLYPVLTECTIG